MGIFRKKSLSLLSTLLIVLAFSFSNNTSATTTPTALTSVTLNTTSSVVNLTIPLTWDWLLKWFKPRQPRHSQKRKRGENGATVSHSANVNPNNNGNAGQGNQGNGVGNYPYGNQGSNGNPNGRTGGGGDSIPLDGGLSILLLGAAAFGVKKLHDKKNDKL